VSCRAERLWLRSLHWLDKLHLLLLARRKNQVADRMKNLHKKLSLFGNSFFFFHSPSVGAIVTEGVNVGGKVGACVGLEVLVQTPE